MKLVLKLPQSKGELEGPPFSIVLNGKSKKNIRNVLLICGIIWIIYSLMGFIIYYGDHVIFSFLLVVALLTAQDKAIVITGDHGNWEITFFRYSKLVALMLKSIPLEDMQIEFRITSKLRNRGALIIIQQDKSQDNITSILMRNIDAKEVKEMCEVIGIPIRIRKRGKKISNQQKYKHKEL